MNKEMKKILSKFCFVNFIICCIIMFAVGTLTAKQQSAYNIQYEKYAVLSMKTQGNKIEMNVDEETITLDFEKIQIKEKIEKYSVYTPFYCVIYFCESLTELINQNF